MNSPEQPIPATVTRANGLVAMALSLPWIFILGYAGEIARGFLAFGSSVVMITLSISYRKFRGEAWFWSTIVILGAAHLALILMLPEPRFPFAAFMIPIFLIDFVVLSFVIGAIGDRAS
jgi:hypothetical protein